MTPEALVDEISRAFGSGSPPGELVRSRLGDEPFQVEEAFRGVSDWRSLEAAFLDSVPNGLASALSFLADEAFQYFLPAFLIADVRGQLHRVDVPFHLTFGLTGNDRSEAAQGRRMFGFNQAQCRVIVKYLEHKIAVDEGLTRDSAIEALNHFWHHRASQVRS